jgi:hypothetical protein
MLALALAVGSWRLASAESGAVRIARATGPIVVDGDLSDPAWRDAEPITTWYETNPGDNVPPKVGNLARLAYDDRYLYAAFEFDDPDPASIRAPYADRDVVDSTTDYGGIILDPEFDKRSAILFLANPRGIQYDAINADVNGGSEDNAPDWFWDSAGRIGERGWTLEIRIPFAALRYPKGDPQRWGVLLYRNRPRDRRYQMFSAKLPRDSGCFICNVQTLEGLSGLPAGGNWTVAPYVVAKQESVPRDGAGSDLVNPAADLDAGVDAKWTPDAGTSIDLTANPDFSQVEADVAQITANERFALFFPEKRPFFLEGSDLLTTPVQAVYTRTITSPDWGARATGKKGATAYTALAAQDDGGGSVVIPGPDGSSFADQDFRSFVALARARHDLGPSFVSGLFTDREVEGGGHNRVAGPDFQWRPNDRDALTGQLLFSDTVTPDRAGDPAAPAEWDGRRMRSHAGELWFQHNDARWDGFADYRDYGSGFRADLGFVPQAGFRELYLEGGRTRRPEKGFLSRQRFFLQADYVEDREGRLIDTFVVPGVGMDGKANSFLRFWLVEQHTRAVSEGPAGPVYEIFPRRRLRWTVQASPWGWLTEVGMDGAYGKDVDFVGVRPARGGQTTLRATVRPTDHLALVLLADRRWLDVDPGDGTERRLFTASVERLRATYTFSARCFLRLIGQRDAVRRDPALYPFPVGEKRVDTSGSLLFAYKLNWQSVFFVGYGDDRTWTETTGDLEPASRSIFVKASYAFQR